MQVMKSLRQIRRLATEGGDACQVLNNHHDVRTWTDEWVASVIVMHLHDTKFLPWLADCYAVLPISLM
jgi:hypothetical protein